MGSSGIGQLLLSMLQLLFASCLIACLELQADVAPQVVVLASAVPFAPLFDAALVSREEDPTDARKDMVHGVQTSFAHTP